MLLQEENTYLISKKPQNADEIAGTFRIKNSADTMLCVMLYIIELWLYLFIYIKMPEWFMVNSSIVL